MCDDFLTSGMNRREFRRDLPPAASQLSAVRGALMEFLTTAGLTGSAVQSLILATHEVLANAVMHASTNIELAARVHDAGVTITVRDFGAWLDRHDARPEGGLGLALAQHLVPDIHISRGVDGTRVTLSALS